MRPPSVPPNESAPSEGQPETVEGIIVFGGHGAILGMEFLRSLDKVLVVGEMVALFDYAIEFDRPAWPTSIV